LRGLCVVDTTLPSYGNGGPAGDIAACRNAASSSFWDYRGEFRTNQDTGLGGPYSHNHDAESAVVCDARGRVDGCELLYVEEVQHRLAARLHEGKPAGVIPTALAMGWIKNRIDHGEFAGRKPGAFYPRSSATRSTRPTARFMAAPTAPISWT
jgi:hypothetical protein